MIFLILISCCIGEISFASSLSSREPFHLEEFLKGTFKNKNWNGTWLTDDSFIYKTESGDINIVNAENLTQQKWLALDIFTNYNKSSFVVSPDRKNVLIRYNPIAVFRHSETAQYVVYEIDSGTYYHIESERHIQYARWAPVGSALAYVYENNIYYQSNVGDPLSVRRLTYNGAPGIIYNGVPDWVYEEEVLGTGFALWFSPDGNKLAFITFNDSNVKEFQYFMYGKPGDLENLYPKTVKLRYPKVGTTNPTIAAKYVNLKEPNIMEQTLHSSVSELLSASNYIITGITWATNTDVVIVAENRVQNIAFISRCDTTLNSCNKEISFKEDRGWLRIQPPIYNKEGTKSLLLISQEEDDDFFLHLVLFDVASKRITRLTRGKRVILSILRWDEPHSLVYYSSTVEGNPSNQHTYVINIKTLEDTCLTCSWQTPEGLCKVAVTHLSKNASYWSKICNGPGPAFIAIENLDTQVSTVWEDNVVLRHQLKSKLRPIIKDINVPLSSGFVARARLWIPPTYHEDASAQYPMIVDVYGGPNSNKISDSFTTGIVNYFTTKRNYIYVHIDGRGSGRNGDNLMFQVYRRLGTFEIEDQIEVTKYLTEHYSFIDKNKVGIWGWSYGGFATIWALIKDVENVFKFGLAVAPVTNFVYYDTIYTERYMGLPTEEDNLFGYKNTDATQQVEHLRNKTLFLIHGNADDNVHYQQSMHLAMALEKADIMFYQQSYPDENHGISGVSPHLYHTIDNFFAQEFKKDRNGIK